jgi:hypothetical protein
MSHHGPPIGKGFGTHVSIYCPKVGHSFLWCPFVMHVVHQKLLFSLFPYFGSVQILSSSYTPSAPLLLDLSSNIGSLLVVRLSTEPFPKFGTSIVLMGISNVVTVSSQISSYVAC